MALAALTITAIACGLSAVGLLVTAARAATPQSEISATAVAADTITRASRQVGTRTLRAGNKGRAVSSLQQLLAAVGIRVSASGRFDRATIKAVRRFQRAGRLTVTGVADAATLRRLKQVASAGTIAAYGGGGFDASGRSVRTRHLGDRIPLRPGMSGRDVKILQSFLGRAGFRVRTDGEFGRATQRQWRAYERAKESRNADGVVDAGELAMLRSDVEGPDRISDDALTTRTTPGERAKLGSDGLAIAPESAPDAVKQIIAAGNRIAKTPYVYGGGHGRWNDRGYDCSGSVSYALHGADGLLDSPLDSSAFRSWGRSGAGDWVTVYTNPGHAYMVVAGLRFDTSGRSKGGTRWQTASRSPSGFAVRHPAGL